jgi:hypothetical protein
VDEDRSWPPSAPTPQLSPTGRVCVESDCETRLSIYNPNEFCAWHQPMIFERMRAELPDDWKRG